MKSLNVYYILVKFKPTGYYKGFRQLISIVEIIIEKGYIAYSLNRDIYPLIAEIYNCNPDSIERNIRTLMLNMDMKNLSIVTGIDYEENMTVKMLIDILVTYIRVNYYI